MSSDLARFEELFGQGKDLFLRGQYVGAARLLAAAAELTPTSAGCQFLLGASRMNTGDVAGALYPLALCVYFEPDNGSGRFALGEALRRLGQPEQAVVHLAYAAYLGNPQAPAMLTQLGLAHCQDCGGPVTTGAADCDSCTAVPRPISSPRPRTWLWAHLPADDFRSRLSLPCEQVAQVARGHLDRYDLDGDPRNIDDALTYLELAAAAAPDAEYPVRLTELGSVYRQRFACHGLPTDLDHAIDCHEQALDGADADATERAMILSNLGVAYGVRYELAAVAADLERAIQFLERAMASPAQDSDQRLAVMANAAQFYRHRYQAGSDPADLDRSIELQVPVVDGTPPGHPRHAGRMANLTVAYVARYERDGLPADLDRAVELAERAIAATPGDSPALPIRLFNRGGARLHRYLAHRESRELDHAIDDLQQALDAMPDGHPQMAAVHSELTRAHLVPGARTRAPDRRTLEVWAARLESASGSSPSDRALAGRNLGTLAHAGGQYDLAARVLDAAVELMPAVPLRGASWTDRERRFGEHRGLVSQVFAAHCALGDPLRAVQQAELGRGLQLATVLDAHDDLTELDRELPQLARAFRQVRKELAGSPPDQSVLLDRYGDLVSRIREHPGFPRFLMAPRVEELRRAAAGGTVVVVNCARNRADAVLIGSDGDARHVPLPGLSSSQVEAQAESMVGSELSGQRDRTVADRLAWLWDTVVQPVSEAFPLDGTPHRVWWLPIGLLGLFPLDAAGHTGRPGALDAFVSSYTPTLRILAYAHDRRPASERRQLTVALSSTPGQRSLPGALVEALDLHRSHPDGPLLLNQEATTGQVATALSTATMAHFACHALADYSAPSNGGLCLSDGMLTIPEISRLALPDAQLAYLSACSTGYRNLEHVDESLNLASAFQLAGFRHVIASLWPLNDHFGTVASRTFYGKLSGAAEDAPEALHRTTLELRSQYPDQPDLWASLIHSGP